MTQKGLNVGLHYPMDETDKDKQALDHYILDDDVIKIVVQTWPLQVDRNFYSTNDTEVITAFFSPPYPKPASDILGYPPKETHEFSDKEMCAIFDTRSI